MWKRKKIVLLPTKGFSPVYKEEDGRLVFDEVLHSYGGVDHYHFYVFGEDKIEPGDWCYDGKRVFQYLINGKSENGINEYSKKVIATTDKTLKYGEDVPGVIQYKFLPWIHISFIEEIFIKRYNDGFVLKNVRISYDDDDIGAIRTGPDNYISIKDTSRLKEMVDEDVDLRKELRLYCSTAFFAGYGNKSLSAEETYKVYDEWIAENIDKKGE